MELLLTSWPTLILIGIGLRIALRLNYGARGPEVGDPVYNFLNVCSWVLIALGLTPAVIGGFVTLFGTIIVALAAATVVEVVIQRRAAQRRSICTLLALLVDRRQPLESAVLLSGQALRGRVGRAARRLFDALNAGVPLTEAIKENPRALPREAIAYVSAAGSQSGESAALRELSRADHSELSAVWRACVDRILYIGCIMPVMLVVLLFLMIKIVPEYERIFYEFDIDLPVVTQFAIAFSNSFMMYLAMPAGCALLLFVNGAMLVGFLYLLDIPVFRGLSDRLFRGRQAADVLRILAVAMEQRQPVADVLYRVARVYPAATVRRQLGPAADAVTSGATWIDALGKTQLVSEAEEALLAASERVGNAPWALRQIAKRREKRAVYRLNSGLQFLYPAVIVFLGFFVGFYVVSLFVPIVTLIQSLT